MVSPDEVKKLAALARLTVDDAELERFAKEFDGILAYVGQLESLSLDPKTKAVPTLRNVMREDGEPHAPGLYTKAIVDAFPEKDGDYLKVKRIISND